MVYTLEGSSAYKILKSRDADVLIGDIQRVFTKVTPLINEICIRFDNYTFHNIDHSLRVLHYMCEIAGDEALNSLSNLELAMIIFSALLHDIGMRVTDEEVARIEQNSQFYFYLRKNSGNKKLALQDFVRPIHGRRSYEFIVHDEGIKSLLCDNRLTTVSYYEDVALLCQSHMESLEWVNESLKENFSKGDHFNSKYIALLLRIADYIDFDSQRAPLYLFEHKMLNAISQTEWEKHAKVCNFDKIDNKNKEIYFDISCDDFRLYTKIMDTIEAMSNEVSSCVQFSKLFSDSKYHLRIKEKISTRVDTIGFSPKRFSFTLDYYSVTNLLMGENLYGEKKLGFRELLQNSMDACSVMKEYYSLNDPTTSYSPEVSIIYDYDKAKVIIKDNGIGMSKDIIDKYFLTIGKSYYRSDEYEKLGYKTNPTGTFGIGFLSCFMLSKEVVVNTKHYASGECTSFLLEKNSKYICHLEDSFLGPHGTAISLSMEDFVKVFSKKELLNFIDENFFRLDVAVKIYSRKAGVLSFEDRAVCLDITKHMNIDLSGYLKGIECKAEIATAVDEFKLFEKCPDDLDRVSNAVLISLHDVQNVDVKSLSDYSAMRCVVLESSSAFEELLNQTFISEEKIGNYDFDIDELIEYFERYGFGVFEPDFDLYKAHEKMDGGLKKVTQFF